MHTATQLKSEGKTEPICLEPGEYEWLRPSRLSAAWNLMHGDEKLTTLSSPKSFGRMVTFESAGENYTIKKGGVRNPGGDLRTMSSDEPITVVSLQNVTTSSISEYGKNYILKRKEKTEEWTLFEGEDMIFRAVRDTSGRLPKGTVTVVKPISITIMVFAWFMIFSDEMQ